MANRGGFKKKTKIPKRNDGACNDGHSESGLPGKRKKCAPAKQKIPRPPHGISCYAVRIESEKFYAPSEYSELDYLDNEEALRQAARGPWRERADVLPQDEGEHPIVTMYHPKPEGNEAMFDETKKFMN